jgi:hypothetical protein
MPLLARVVLICGWPRASLLTMMDRSVAFHFAPDVAEVVPNDATCVLGDATRAWEERGCPDAHQVKIAKGIPAPFSRKLDLEHQGKVLGCPQRMRNTTIKSRINGQDGLLCNHATIGPDGSKRQGYS